MLGTVRMFMSMGMGFLDTRALGISQKVVSSQQVAVKVGNFYFGVVFSGSLEGFGIAYPTLCRWLLSVQKNYRPGGSAEDTAPCNCCELMDWHIFFPHSSQ